MATVSDEESSGYEEDSGSGSQEESEIEEEEEEEEEEEHERVETVEELDGDPNVDVISIPSNVSKSEGKAPDSERDVSSKSPNGEEDGPDAQILFEQIQSSGIVRRERDDESLGVAEQPSGSVSTMKQKRKQTGDSSNSGDQPPSKKQRGRPSKGKTPAVSKKNLRRSPVVEVTLAANRPRRSQAATARKILGQEGNKAVNRIARNNAQTGEAFESQSESTNVRTGKKLNERGHGKKTTNRRKDKEINLIPTGTEDDHAGEDHTREDHAEEDHAQDGNAQDGNAQDGNAENEDEDDEEKPKYPDQNEGMFKRSVDCLGKEVTLESAVTVGSNLGREFWELLKKLKKESGEPNKKPLRPEDVKTLSDKINATTADYINQYDITNKIVNENSKITIIPLGQWYSNEERLNDILDLASQIEEDMKTSSESEMKAITLYVYGEVCPWYINLVNTLVHYYEVDKTLNEDVTELLHKHSLAVERLLKATDDNLELLPEFFPKNRRRVYKKGLPKKMEALRLAFKWEITRVQMQKQDAILHEAETERRLKIEKRRRRELAAREKRIAREREARISQANSMERPRIGNYNRQPYAAANLPSRPRDVSEWTEAEIKRLIEGLVITADQVGKVDRMENLNLQFCPHRGYEDVLRKAYSIARAVYKRHDAGEYGGLETLPQWVTGLVGSRTYD